MMRLQLSLPWPYPALPLGEDWSVAFVLQVTNIVNQYLFCLPTYSSVSTGPVLKRKDAARAQQPV